MIFVDKFGFEFKCDFDFTGCNTLVLSGGALKCIYFLGALSRINLDFTNYAATSCGSIISTLLCIGYSPTEIFKVILNKNEEEFKTSNVLDIVIKNIEQMFVNKNISPSITFNELEKLTNKKLAFVTTNVSKLKEEIFSSETYPNTPVITAIKLSCAIPIIFPLAKYNNDIYIDGIFFDNFPIKLCKLFKTRNKILALSTDQSYYDKSISKFYSKSDCYKIIYIPDRINKYFKIPKHEKIFMFVSAYNFIHKNILKTNKTRRHRIKTV